MNLDKLKKSAAPLVCAVLLVVSPLLAACGGTNNTGAIDPLRDVECALVQPGTFMGGACGK